MRQLSLSTRSLTVAAILVWVVSGCQPVRPIAPKTAALEGLRTAAPDDAARVLVDVNGTAITREVFYQRVLEKGGVYSLQRQIIDDELFLQAASERELSVPDDAVEKAVDAYFDDLAERGGGRSRFIEELERQGLSFDELRKEMRPQIRMEMLKLSVVVSLREIDEETLRKYYKQTYRKKRFATRHMAFGSEAPPPGAGAEAGRIKLLAFERAKRAATRVREGHDFAEICKAESDDQVTRDRGGDLGAIAEDDPLPGEFKEAIFALKVGEVSEPIENPQVQVLGFHIFQVTAILPSESYVDCVDKMKKELKEREPTPKELADVLTILRRQARIVWHG